MNRVISILVFLLFVLSFIGTINAAEGGNKINVAAGAVKAVDAQAKTVTLMADNKPDFICSFDDKTVVRANTGKNISATDIKLGYIAVVAYTQANGKNIAKSITLAPP